MKLEVNISRGRTVVSQIFKLIVSTSEKILKNTNVLLRRNVKKENTVLPVAVRGSATEKRCLLKLTNELFILLQQASVYGPQQLISP